MKEPCQPPTPSGHVFPIRQELGAVITRTIHLLFIIATMSFISTVGAQDWPQWRYDANRSGATEQTGPVDAVLLWSKTLPHPDPAYDHQYRMCADVTYAPVAAEGLVFIPSNVTDQVMACDIVTGAVKWRYVTEGPVRLAPVYLDGRLYFGADDGYLHCVSATDGKLLWKVRGAPETHPDCRMLAGGRLCSRWPVRGAPVTCNGVVYFGAGIWPEEGVFVCAVDAETGNVIWRSDSMSYVKDGMSDHGKPYDLSLPPQGYLAIIDGKFAVPSGRSLAAWFDPDTGAMEPYTCFYVKHNPPRGTWYLSGVNQYWVQGGSWFGTRPDAMPELPAELEDAKSAIFWSKQPPENELHVIKNRPFLRADTYILHPENWYTEPVLTKTTAYASEFVGELKYLVPRGHTHVAFPDYDRIVARDLTKPQWQSVEHKHISYGGREVTMPRLEFPILWELKSPLRVLIKAGDRLFAGGQDTIAAIAVPKRGEEARITWQAKIEGRPVEALVADRKLVVVTHNGNVYCFGDGNGRDGKAATESRNHVRWPSEAVENPGTTASEGHRTVETASPPILSTRSKSQRNGYALLFGFDNGTRAKTLANDSHYRVIVLEPDADRAAKAKATLSQEGMCGHQVQVIESDLAKIQLTPYWANLVVVESLDGFGSPERALSIALDALRPYTGALRLSGMQDHTDLLKRLLAARTGYAMELEPEGVTVRREAPPAGADDWTHEPGGPDNCFANSDRLVKWPLGVLWYSGDIDRYFTPASHFQHERHPYPLVTRGRMFIITGQFLHAVDIYTGDYLWKAEMPMTPWIQTRNFDSRVYGRPTERNCVAAEDWVYTVTGKTIHAYDAATGEGQKVFEIPPEFREQAVAAIGSPQTLTYHGHRAEIQGAPEWTEVRLWNDLLLAMLGQSLVAVDRHSGEVCWTRPSTQQATTYALGDDALYGLDCDVPRMGGGADGERSGRLFAINPENGAIIWEKPLAYTPVPKHSVTHTRLWLRPIIPALSYNAKHGLIVLAVNRKSIHVFQAADGSPVWSKANVVTGDVQRIYPPAVTDDYLLLSDYKGCHGYLFDIRTGEEVGDTTGIPRPRTCARIIGNNHLLVYRDAATEFYDIDSNRIIGLNSVRSGCTTSFIPACGVMTAPMLGHGCVCNYPMFASLGLYHLPAIEQYRPAAVTASWKNQAEELLAEIEQTEDVFTSGSGKKIDIQKFHLINGTVNPTGSAVLFSTKDATAGYAVRESTRPLQKAVFDFFVKRAVGAPGEGRHGNASFVCGKGNTPEDLIECRLYYGGRGSMMITGSQVEHVEEKIRFDRKAMYQVTVTVDCENQTVTFETSGQKLASRITGPVDAITHYGYGGSNSANLFTDITER
ncbi:MAG: PQQ-binding-like beta-propeller repeat protein [Planctomycetes bacterium]|nr:PQQ-binding-like beta-propeller repeat protein [Planctomycetota bacterium]MBL7039610.1 PQQ-binding-like beta-propeller repeat protein [Pirellulaceae bacterium]